MARVDLRVSDAELAEWKAKAGERGLSAWIREHCNSNSEPGQAQPSAVPEESIPGLLERIARGLARMNGTGWYFELSRIESVLTRNKEFIP